MRWAGVDLGKKGAIVILDDNTISYMGKMPVVKSSKTRTQYDAGRINYIFDSWKPGLTILEKPIFHPKSGKFSVYNSGYCFGLFTGVLETLKLSYDYVTPNVWQREIFKGNDRKDTKQASYMFCKRMFPGVIFRHKGKIQDGICDATCLAYYGRMKHGGIK